MTVNMAGRRKKVAAALAAVSLYLEQEEAVACGRNEVVKEPGSAGVNHWAHSGRQEMMVMRRLMQVRGVRF